jgi:cell division protein FtsQ
VKERTKNIIISVLIWLAVAILAGYCIFAIIMFGSKDEPTLCKNIVIDIDDKYNFIQEEEIIKTLKRNKIYPTNKPISHKDADKIEKVLSKLSLSKEVECYIGDSTLYIDITQRKPVYRVFTKNNETYYVDSDRKIMPTSKNFTAKVPIALGHIDKIEATEEVYDIITYLEEDKYWNSLFKQIYVTQDKELIFISKQGVEEILLGDIKNYKEKLEVLKKWYEQYPERNCDTLYSRINLKFENLIYCTRKK